MLHKYKVRSKKYRRWLQRLASRRPAVPIKPDSIAMIHGSRSGSTVLGDLLIQHDDIHWDEEVFSWQRKSNWVLRPLFRNRDRLLRFRMGLAENQRYGFETQFMHLRTMKLGFPEYLDWLGERGFKQFVLLERNNYLRITISALLGFRRSKWHQMTGSKAKLSQIKINPKDVFRPAGKSLIWILEWHENNFGLMKEALSGRDWLHLVYEEDVQKDPTVAYRRLCEYLSIPYTDASVRYGKTNPFSLSEMVTNFDELEAELKGTRFEWMLYD